METCLQSFLVWSTLVTKFCRLRLSDLVEKKFIIVPLPSQLPWPLTFNQYFFEENSHDPRLEVRSLPIQLSLRRRYVNSCITKNRPDLTCNRNIPYVVSGDLTIPALSDLVTYSFPTFLNTSLNRKKTLFPIPCKFTQLLFWTRFTFLQLLVTLTLQHMFFDVRDSKVSFNKRNLSESSLFMVRLSNFQ